MSTLDQDHTRFHIYYSYFPPFQFVAKSSMAVIALFLISFLVTRFAPIHITKLSYDIPARFPTPVLAYPDLAETVSQAYPSHRQLPRLDQFWPFL